MAKCKCDCGAIVEKPIARIRSSRVKSCGCLRSEKCRERNIENGRKLVLGERFGKLTVIEDLGYRSDSRGYNIHWCKCLCDCGNYLETKCNNLYTGGTQSCGCVQSRGERIISEILRENNIPFKQQVSFEELKSEKGWRLRFDFGIYGENGVLLKLIEFDGRQHFTGPNAKWTQSYSLEEIKIRDKMKNEYCFLHHIPLLRIPYNKIQEITIEKLLNEETPYMED